MQSLLSLMFFLAYSTLSFEVKAEDDGRPRVVTESDGSKHFDSTYGNGYAAARIEERAAKTLAKANRIQAQADAMQAFADAVNQCNARLAAQRKLAEEQSEAFRIREERLRKMTESLFSIGKERYETIEAQLRKAETQWREEADNLVDGSLQEGSIKIGDLIHVRLKNYKLSTGKVLEVIDDDAVIAEVQTAIGWQVLPFDKNKVRVNSPRMNHLNAQLQALEYLQYFKTSEGAHAERDEFNKTHRALLIDFHDKFVTLADMETHLAQIEPLADKYVAREKEVNKEMKEDIRQIEEDPEGWLRRYGKDVTGSLFDR